MNLVGRNPARDVEQVSDVLRAGACRARSSESRVVKAREGPIKGALWKCRRGEPGEDHSGQMDQGWRSEEAPEPNACPLAH